MNVSRESSENGEIVLRLEVEDELFNRHMTAAVRRVAQRVNIPGFRKGKAPRAILQNFVGKEYLVEETMESLVPEAVGNAVRDEEIIPFAPPRVNIEQSEPPVTILATVPLIPSVELAEYRSIRYDDEPEPVTDEAVDNLLMYIRRNQAYSVPVERAVQESDIVAIDIKMAADDEVIWDFEDREFQINTDVDDYGEIIVGVNQGIIGMSAGEEKEFSFPVSEDADNPQLAGKTANVNVTLKGVSEEMVPELDDAMVIETGIPDVETVEQLTAHVRDQQEQIAERAVVTSVEGKLFDELIEASEFAISPIVVEHEGRRALEQIVRRRFAMEGKSTQQITADDVSEEDVNFANESAEREIKQRLVLDRLVEAEDIEVTDDEATAEIEQWNSANTAEDQKLEDNDQTRESVKSFVRRRRTIEKVVRMARGMDDAPEEQSD